VQEFVAAPCTTELFELGECCRWDDVRGELNWVDVLTGRFFRARVDANQVDIQRTYELPGVLTAFAPFEDRADGWIVALNQSICHLQESGEITELASPEAHQAADVRMNDGSADPWGRFWIGSMAFNAEVGRGSLYRFHESSGTQTVKANVTISNGLGWSADRRTMYYVDSGPGTVSAFDVDANGDVSNERVLVQFDVAKEGAADGLCIDEEDALWLAVWGGYEVRRYSPRGKQLARVQISTAQPSCCAIGGANGTTLYVTTAREDMSDELLEREADAGRLFAVDVGVAGTPLLAYRPRRELDE
jgi:sugar lactone lactonase YvrE